MEVKSKGKNYCVSGTLIECYTSIYKLRQQHKKDGFMTFSWFFNDRPINHKNHQAEMTSFIRSLGNATLTGRDPSYRILVRFTDTGGGR